MLIVGSKALKYHYPNFPRKVNDIDIIGFESDVDTLILLLNPSLVKKFKHTVLFKNITNKTEFFDTDNVEILLADNSESFKRYLEIDKGKTFASKKTLFSLKKSHINFAIKFKKHIHDYCFLYDELGGIDDLSDITKLNYLETEKRVGKIKTPSLNVTVDEFFKQSEEFVKPQFAHDDLHKIMAYYDKPLYEKMQDDKSMARCNLDKWVVFSYEDKCKCVLEEAYVIALERKIIPMLFSKGKFYTSEEAFDWALTRICTNLCSGWFREFATNNYFIIKLICNKNYVEKFLENYENDNITRQTSN